MLISLSRNFLFIHIPKTAGTSVRDCLSPFALTPERCWENRLLARCGIHVNLISPWPRKKFRAHCRTTDVCRHIPPDVFHQLFKFAFVRNPWGMLVSLYHFIPTRKTHRHSRRCANMDFADFVDEWTQRPETPQWPRVCDSNGRLLLDFVGRYEHLGEDFAKICSFIGIPYSLPQLNRSQHSDYRTYYNNRLQSLVQSRLANDIEFFGYQFEDVLVGETHQLNGI